LALHSQISNNRQIYLLFFTLLFFSFPLFSQEDIADPSKNNIIEQRIEDIADDNQETTVDYTNLFDDLQYYYEYPLNLNTATREDLAKLNLLTDVQINSLREHIIRNGKLISILELQAIDNFDMETIKTILPFVKVKSELDSPHIGLKDIFKNSKSELFLRGSRVLQEQVGYTPIDSAELAKSPNKRYLGSPEHLYMRYRFRFGNNISAGFTADKDPGEEFFTGSQKQGFDYYSAHLFFRNYGKIKHLAIGDYQAQFGQGLTMWTGVAFGKSPFVMNVKRNAQALLPYASVNENQFLRGAATTVSLGKFDITGFYSYKSIDANVSVSDTTSAFEGLTISSFQISGLHRTPSELRGKDAVKETIYGSHITYNQKRLTIGATAVSMFWSGNVQRNLSFYNQFDLNNNRNTNYGIDYNYVYRNFNFFGETAMSENGAYAYTNGILMNLSQTFSVVLLNRNFQRNYQSFYAVPVSESTGANNEKGTYMGISAVLPRGFYLTAYFDRFVFPWLKYQVNAPSQGVDYLAQVTYKPSKVIELYARIKQETKSKNTSESIDDIDFLVETDKTNIRFNAIYKISETIQLRNRVEYVTWKFGTNTPQNGYLIFQDVTYKGMKSPVSLSYRMGLFDTDSYDARIYAYENDVLYAFSIPAFYGRGLRNYIVLRYTFNRNIDLWLRYAQTFYNDRYIIGSGLNQINGRQKSEVKIQFRFRF
jgi:hypothetical protein